MSQTKRVKDLQKGDVIKPLPNVAKFARVVSVSPDSLLRDGEWQPTGNIQICYRWKTPEGTDRLCIARPGDHIIEVKTLR